MSTPLISPALASQRLGVKLPQDEQHFKAHFSSLALTFLLAKEIQRRFGEALSIHRPDLVPEAAESSC